MNWMFVVDIAFYAVLGLLTFPLLVLGIALLSGMSFDGAYKKVKEFLSNWSEVEPQDFLNRVLRASGITAVLFLLGFAAWLANRVGDAGIGYTAGVFGYFGNQEVRWSVQSRDEFDDMGFELRDLTGIGPDRVKWEQAKAAMGRYDVRFFRTLGVMSLFVAVAAVGALLTRRGQINPTRTLIGAVLVLVVSHWLWAERQQQYVMNFVSRYASEYKKAHGVLPQRPPSYRGWWPKERDASPKP